MTDPKKLGTSNMAPALIDMDRVSMSAATNGLLDDMKYTHNTTYRARMESLNNN